MSVIRFKEIEKAKLYFSSLSTRERNLISLTGFVFVAILVYWALQAFISFEKSTSLQVKSKANLVEQISQAAIRHRNLNTKLHELTTKYLNSSLSFEDLTNNLDKITKNIIGADAYELIPSKDKSDLGTDFISRKFTIKIRKCSYDQIIKMLQALEVGPPALFIQKVDLAKSSDNKSVSALLEIVSIQEKTN